MHLSITSCRLVGKCQYVVNITLTTYRVSEVIPCFLPDVVASDAVVDGMPGDTIEGVAVAEATLAVTTKQKTVRQNILRLVRLSNPLYNKELSIACPTQYYFLAYGLERCNNCLLMFRGNYLL